MNTAPIVSKVWGFCTTLRDDDVGSHSEIPIRSTRKCD